MAKMWKSRLKSRWNGGGLHVEKKCGKIKDFIEKVDKCGFTQSFSTSFHILFNHVVTSVKIVSFPLFTHSLILQLQII